MPQSKIGELAILARRKGAIWYVSCLNGEKPLQIDLQLEDFLSNAGTYAVELVQDGRKNNKVEVKKFRHNSSEPVSLKLLSGGGFLLKVLPVN